MLIVALAWVLVGAPWGATVVVAQTPPTPTSAAEQLAPVPGSVSAASAILVDLTSNQVLLGREMHTRRAIASLTKVMTAVVALRFGRLTDELVVEQRDLPGEASIGLRPGDRLSLEAALYGMLMRSGNDAASLIARTVGERVARENNLIGSDGVTLFVDLMNRQAADLGMSNTRYANPHGLDMAGQHSSAYDQALLVRHAMRDATFQRMFESRSYPYRSGLWTNVNRLLYQYEGSLGGKTGIESQSGLCLIEVAQRGDRRLTAIVLNAPQWYGDAVTLLDYGFGDGRQQPLASQREFSSPSVLSGAPIPLQGPLLGRLAVTPTSPVAPGGGGSGPAPATTISNSGAGGDLSAQAVATVAAQSSEGDQQLLQIGLIVLGLLVAFAVISIGLRLFGVGPWARRDWPDVRPRRPHPLRSPPIPEIPAQGEPVRATESDSEGPAPPSANGPAEADDLLGPPSTKPVRAAANQTDERVAAHIAVAARYVTEGRHAAAESTFIKAIQVAPEFRFTSVPAIWSMGADGFAALAAAYMRCNRPVDARAIVAMGLVEFPDYPDLKTLDEYLQAERRRGHTQSVDPATADSLDE